MNNNQEKEYERDYKHAMEHPHKGVKCTNCIATYFNPLLGCPKCGNYKDIYTPANNEVNKLRRIIHDGTLTKAGEFRDLSKNTHIDLPQDAPKLLKKELELGINKLIAQVELSTREDERKKVLKEIMSTIPHKVAMTLSTDNNSDYSRGENSCLVEFCKKLEDFVKSKNVDLSE